MILNRDEAICLILGLSNNNEVSSPTKLNKLLARLNLLLIPIDIDFKLNKYGSFNTNLDSLNTTEYYSVEPYSYKPVGANTVVETKKFKLTTDGEKLFENVMNKKLDKIYSDTDFEILKKTIYDLSKLPAKDISEDEHQKLLVDTDTRHKLIGNSTSLTVDMFDVFNELKNISSDNIIDIRLRALIEYCYHLSIYLKNKFDKLDDSYDYEAYMFDYYFLFHLEQLVPFLQKQISAKEKDAKAINKYYQYIINSVKERYPFSLENEHLPKMIAQ
jgi:hypothetical protein